MFWQAASVIVNSVLAAVTVGVLVMNYQQVKANRQQVQASEDQARAMHEQVKVSQEQVRISREQFRQSQQQLQETLEASRRPFLFPCSPLTLKSDTYGLSFDFEQLDPGETVKLKNDGTGIAFNVWGTLVQPRPRVETELHLAPRMRSVVLEAPLPPGDEVEVATKAGPFAFDWNVLVGDDPRNTLCAPRTPTLEEQLKQQTYHVVARLTLTYDDMFGRTHASQFDCIEQGRWVFHGFLPKIGRGLEALAREQDLHGSPPRKCDQATQRAMRACN